MVYVQLISPKNGELIKEINNNLIKLSQSSIIKINLNIEDVARIARQGNTAVITLNNGETITLENYFDYPSDTTKIIFENNGKLYWVQFTTETGEVLDTINYLPVEILVAEGLATDAAASPWLIAAGVATGSGIAVKSVRSDGNNQNNNKDTLNDATDLAAATDAVQAAQDAHAKAQDAVSNADTDGNGLINEAEQQAVQGLIDAATAFKETAQALVDGLEENVQANKDALQARLDGLTDLEAPALTDANDNGVDDSAEASLQAATDAVQAAQDAHAKAQDAVSNADTDGNGLINEAEQQAVQGLIDAATAFKETAQALVDGLEENVQANKDALQARLDGLTDLEAPALTDANDNGVDDSAEASLQAATDAVQAAQDAHAKAQDAVSNADTDGNGLINEAEQQAVQGLIDAATAFKETAQALVDGLEENVQANKDALQARLDGLTDLEAPALTDANDNGVDDSAEASLQAATDAVQAAQDAHAKAQDAVSNADTDGNGLINEAEQQAVQGLIDAATAFKETAQALVDGLEENVQANKDALQARLDGLTDLEAPALTDANDNGVDDSAEASLQAATDAVQAAQDAHAKAQDAVSNADTDGNGLINEAEQQAVQGLIDAATAFKETAQALVDGLEENVQANKDALQARLDGLTDLEAPALTDANDNGVDDSAEASLQAATDAVQAAQDAHAKAQDAVSNADTDGNGLINEAEQQAVQGLIDAATAFKETAQALVDGLEENVQANKDALQARLDGLTDLEAPALTDANDNGVDDSAEASLQAATDAVQAAQDAHAKAQDAVSNADTDGNGLINEAEQQAVQGLIDAATAFKESAQALVDGLEENVQANKDALQARLDGLTDLEAPALTDANDNGVDDSAEASLQAATDAVQAAQDAHAKAQDAVSNADTDGNGLINEAEQQAVQGLIDAATAFKETAQALVDGLEENVQANKDALQARLDGLTDLEAPALTDANDNGVDDSAEASLQAATDAVQAAQDAHAKAQDAVSNADTDGNGLINEAEQQAVQGLIDAATAFKETAQALVDGLEENVQANKDALQARLDGLTDLEAPALTDANDNGVDDSAEASLQAATDAVQAAQDAHAKAQDAVSNADTDGNGLINEAEQQAVQGLIDAATAFKESAQALVDGLEENVQANKDALQARLDGLTDLEAPALTDANDNGVDDSAEASLQAATDAVQAAQDAHAKAQDAVSNADTDGNGLINEAEQQAVQGLIDAATAFKETAQALVDGLEENVQANKDALQARLDGLTDLEAPALTDANDNGVDDSAEASLQAATDAVQAAQDAHAKAQDAVSNADTDGNGLINEAEQQAVQGLIDAATAFKETAQALVDGLEENVQANKDALQARLDGLTDLEAPALTDANDNGVDDSAEASLQAATDAVQAAQDAHAKAQDAVSNADTDGNGLINEAEQQAVQGLIDAATAFKESAQALVDGLEENVQANKDALQARLDGLTDLEAPALTDANDNGVDDSAEASLQAATDAVQAAQDAHAKAQDAVSNADTDGNGLINEAEQQAVQGLIDAATAFKETAQALVDGLEENVQANKDALQARLDGLTDLEAPALTDANDNGVDDSAEASLQAATDAVQAAQDAHAKAQDAVSNADTDGNGLINEAEQQAVQGLIDAATAFKESAQALVDGLEENVQANKDALQARLDGLTDLEAPALTDANDNGVDDSAEASLQAATDAVQAAQDAHAKAQDAVSNADTDGNGLINEAEQQAVQGLIDAATAFKETAQALVDGLEENVQANKDALQARLDGLTDLEAPALTDANDNGVDDSAEASLQAATDAVQAAQDAHAKAQDAVSNADTDGNGLINEAEQQAVQGLIDAATAFKETAQALVDGLEENVQANKDALQARLDGLTDLEAPALTDANDNGVDDSAEASLQAATDAVQAAQDAHAKAQDAVSNADTDGNGLINEAEQQAVQGLIDAATAFKESAQALVDGLEENVQANKDALQARLDGLTDLEAPALTDANDNGVDDSAEASLQAATDAVQAAQDAHAKAQDAVSNADTDGNGLINEAEQQAVQGLIDAATAFKETAQALVDGLEENVQANKDALQARLDGLTDLEAPALTDANDNGVDDSAEASLQAATDAVQAAQDAHAKAQDAVSNADTDGNGLINEAEQQAVQGLIDAATAFKETAQALVDGLEENVQANKDALQARLDGLTDLEAPALTDANDNGVDDSAEASLQAATDAVQAAQDAHAKAQDAVSNADTDGNGLINEAEQQAVQGLIDAATAFKESAQALVDGLEENVQANKDALQARLDGLTDLEAPALTDANDNGVDDSAEASLQAATDAVQAAQDAHAKAQDAVSNADTDGNGLINEAEQQAVQGLIDAATAFKETAQALVDGLEENVQANKDALQARLDGLTDLEAPALTDANDNGVDDSAEASLQAATDAVQAAQDAHAKAQDAVSNADTDGNGLINEAEQQAVQGLIDAATAFKESAQALVDGLEENVQANKDALQARLDGLTDLEAPALTDANDNGVDDSAEASLQAATDAVQAAQDAHAKAQDAVSNADTDGNGLINEAEQQAVQGLIDAATAFKETAQALVDGLEENVQANKDALQARLDGLTDLEAPALTDANDNGVDDSAEASLQAATDAVQAAQDAHAKAQDAVSNADTDGNGLINEAEQQAVQGLIDAATAFKETAQALVDGLEENVQANKDALQARLDGLTDLEAPALTDANDNGVDDSAEASLQAATDAVQAAQDAHAKAQDAVSNADTDGNGLINEAEQQAVQGLIDAATAFKESAQALVDGLEENVQANKDALQARLDGLTDLEAPALTDANDNGVDDRDLLAVDNDVQLKLDITPSIVQLEEDQSLVGKKATSFGVASIGLGGVANVSALAFGSYIDVSVGDDQVRELSLKADGGGLSIGEAHDLVILKEDEWGNWNVVQLYQDWFTIPFLGYIQTSEIRLDEPGNYKVYLAKTNGIGVLSGSGLEITDDAVYDYSVPTAVSGSISGNVLTDLNNQSDVIDSKNGKDILTTHTILESVTVGGKTYPIDQITSTVIEGEYGTLTIEPNGDYTYTLSAGAQLPFGSVETFSYTLKDTATGKTSNANLKISLDKDTVEIDPVVQHMTLEVQSSVVTQTEKLKDVSQVNILGVGLGIADIKVATIESGMEINVATGHTREVSFSSSGGAPIAVGGIPVSLAIYKYNEIHQNWELYALKEDWYTLVGVVIGAGASSENIDILFTEGKYKAVTLSSIGGIAVLPTIVLKADTDILYDYTQATIKQQLDGDLTTGNYADFKMRTVNDQPVDDTPIQGKYGTLYINADGTYHYVVDPKVPVELGDIDTFNYSIKDPVTGKLATGTLNIQLDIIEARDDQNDAKFGLDNTVDYQGWHVDERTATSSKVKEFSHEISVGKNQIFDLQLAYSFDQFATSAKADQYLIRLTNITTGEVTEILNTTADSVTNTVTLPSLTEGNYRIDVLLDNSLLWPVDVKLNLTGNVTTLDGFTAEASNIELAEGDLLANDIFSENQIASLKIQGQILFFDKHGKYEHTASPSIILHGQHGTLTVNEDGTYIYQASGTSYGVETFEYTLNSIHNTSQTAQLVINVGKKMTGSQYDDVISGSDGQDSLVFNLLNESDPTGGNGTDFWNDFHLGDIETDSNADKINVSALLLGNSTNLRDYISITDDGQGNALLSIDRDGSVHDTTYDSTELLILHGVNKTDNLLDQLINNGQLF